MKTEIKQGEFTISETEAIELFHALKLDLEHTIDSHWVNHPGIYSQQANSRIHMMREFSRLMHTDAFPAAMADLNLRLEAAVKAKAK